MRKRILDFLRYLENETSITFTTDMFTAPEQYIDSKNRPCRFIGLSICNGPFFLIISSSIGKNDKKINGLVIICLVEDQFSDARYIQSRIQSTVPSIPVLLRTSIYDFDPVNLKSIMIENFQ